MSVGYESSVETEGTQKFTSLYADFSYLKRAFVQKRATDDDEVVNRGAMIDYMATLVDYVTTNSAGFVIAYTNTFGGDVYYGAIAANLNTANTPVPVNCRYARLFVRTNSPATGGYIEYEVYKNSVATGIIITQAEGEDIANGPVDLTLTTDDVFAVKKTSFGAAAASTTVGHYFTLA